MADNTRTDFEQGAANEILSKCTTAVYSAVMCLHLQRPRLGVGKPATFIANYKVWKEIVEGMADRFSFDHVILNPDLLAVFRNACGATASQDLRFEEQKEVVRAAIRSAKAEKAEWYVNERFGVRLEYTWLDEHVFPHISASITQKVKAIRNLKTETGLSLADAKELVEEMQHKAVWRRGK